MHAAESIEFPEFGMTMVVDQHGRVDYVAWVEDEDEEESEH
jgi:hypothetical protein